MLEQLSTHIIVADILIEPATRLIVLSTRDQLQELIAAAG